MDIIHKYLYRLFMNKRYNGHIKNSNMFDIDFLTPKWHTYVRGTLDPSKKTIQ
jgi:hypothetical protein